MIITTMIHVENDSLARSDFNGETKYESLSPDGSDSTMSIKEYMSDKILNIAKTELMWILDLNLYYKDIIRLLNYMEFNDVTKEDPSIKNMPARSYKYTVSSKGNAYAIYIRHNKTLYIYNINNMLANISPEDICAAWGSGNSKSPRDLVDSAYKGLQALGAYNIRKTPYTLSMVAQRKWKQIEDLYFCENLTNCKNYDAPSNYGANLSEYIRKSYQAGWNYDTQRPRSEYMNTPGAVYDINSSYPYVMATKPIPWGEPSYFYNEIPEEAKDDYHYYFVRVRIKFNLKEGNHLPYLRKRGDFMYNIQDYMSTSDILYEDKKTGKIRRTSKIIGMDGKPQEVFPEFVLSKTDYEIVHRHYNIEKEEVIDGVYYRTIRNAFKHFVGVFYAMKNDSKKSGDKGSERIAKIILNGACGTLAKRETRENLVYNNINMKPEIVKSQSPSQSYIHMASAILSYAREIVYEAACANYDNFLYADTDSIHIMGRNPKGIEISPTKLGAWKLEREFDDAYYYKRKSYALMTNTPDGPRYHLVMSGVEHHYTKMLEDILAGASMQEIIIAMTFGDKYGPAKNVWKLPKYTNPNDEDTKRRDPEIVEDVDRKEFTRMMESIGSSPDMIAILNFVKFPTGADYCNDFTIGHKVIWRKLHIR